MFRLYLFVLILATAQAGQAAEFTAQIVDSISGDPVAGANVYLQDHVSEGNSVIAQSDSWGTFRFNSDAPFVLLVEHPDFEQIREVARSNPTQTLRLEMISKSAASLTADELALLADYASHDGRALFLFPYQLHTDIEGFDELLEFNLDAAINSHLQSLDQDVITVQLLPESLNRQGNRTLLYGHALRALALVSGVSGNLPNGKINLRSRFRIVSGGQGLVYVSDQINPSDISAAAFDHELNELWGQSTFLSIAYRRFEEATTANPIDKVELSRIEDAMVAFIRDLPEANSYLARQATKLLDTISRKLQP
jgi:hypothetical protein